MKLIFKLKLIKVISCMLLVFILVFSFASCIPGVNVKVDKDGNLKIKGEDGDIEIGKTKWDTSKMFGLDGPKANLESCVSADGGVIYSFSGMKEKDAEAYINKIKEAGFTYNTVILNDLSFSGTNKDGKTISFMYNENDGTGTVVAAQGEKPSEKDNHDEAVIGGGGKKWYSDKMGGLPDPGVAVTSYWSIGSDTSYILERIKDHLKYVEKIKSCGFTIDPSEIDIDELYTYSALNSNGDRVTFSSSRESATISFVKYE